MNDVKCVKCGQVKKHHHLVATGLFCDWHPTNRFTPAESPASQVQLERQTMGQLSARIAELEQKLAAAERERDELAGRLFPIMGGPAIPWRLLTPHERQAQQNHGGQSLKRLAERGGLGPCEAVAILEDRKWHPMDRVMALARLKELVESDLRAENERLRGALRGLVDRLDVVHDSPEYHGVWEISHAHFGPYNGPTYTDALQAARAALEGKGGVA